MLGIELLDPNNEPVDDATLILEIRPPAAHRDEATVIENASLDHDGTGLYSYPLDLDDRGLYCYRWQTSGLVPLAEERRIYSRPGAFVPAGS